MKRQAILFALNGGMATLVHFAVLSLLIEIFDVQSLVHANLAAGFVAITYSFLGNKYFVFDSHNQKILYQLLKFVIVYVFVLFVHTFIINELSNVRGMDYRAAFVVASLVAIIFSFLSNRFMVFKE